MMKNFFELRKERNDKTVIYNYVSRDLTFVTRDSKSSYKSKILGC